MQIRIHPTRTIKEVQSDFSNYFPYLKLEFFSQSAFSLPAIQQHIALPSNKKIGRAQTNLSDGYLNVVPEMKVKELEQKLKEEFSLSAQVFRRSGNVWLQTTMTDNWTLQQQNEHAKELLFDDKPELPDFDLERDT